MPIHFNSSQIAALFLSDGVSGLEPEMPRITRAAARGAAALLTKRLTSESERVKKPTEEQAAALEAWVAEHFASAGKRGAASKPFNAGDVRQYKVQRHKKTRKGYIVLPLESIVDESKTHVTVTLVDGKLVTAPA